MEKVDYENFPQQAPRQGGVVIYNQVGGLQKE